MATKQFLQPARLSKPTGYTHVVAAQGERMIFIAGQVAYDASGQLVGPGNLRAQTEQVFRNLEVALDAAGATFSDVVKWTTFVVDLKPADRTVIAEVRQRFLGRASPPASTLIGVQALVAPDLLIEIEAIAVVD